MLVILPFVKYLIRTVTRDRRVLVDVFNFVKDLMFDFLGGEKVSILRVEISKNLEL